MSRTPFGILQVAPADIFGGAERIAWNLFQTLRANGYDSWFAVGQKQSIDPYVVEIPNDAFRGRWYRFWTKRSAELKARSHVRGFWRLRRLTRTISQPGKWLDSQLGLEAFRFPGTRQLLELTPKRPDIIHCHNLHNFYFDLRELPWLSRRLPVIVTLHDQWMLTGHCSHSFDCERWKTGCGRCPDLSIYPSIKRDATAYNWQRKRKIYSKSHLYVATPSEWLLQHVKQSMLAPYLREARVIHNGVDLSVFRPGDRKTARASLELPQDAKILLFVAKGIRRHVNKDYAMMRTAVGRIADSVFPNEKVLFVGLGEKSEVEMVGRAEVRLVPFQPDVEAVARYYQAADLYLHAARGDTFPNTVLEALACGIPAVATAVGGIPEQIKSLTGASQGEWPTYSPAQATGILVAQGDTDGMVGAIQTLLSDSALRNQVGETAAQDAHTRFGLARQVREYLNWYEELLASN